MNFKIRLPHCKVRLALFVAYNLFYVLYMLNYVSQFVYLGTLVLFCAMNGFILLNKKNYYIALRELKLGIGYVLTFLIISIFIQLIHSDFQTYLFSGIIRITIPIINAFLFVNTVRREDQKYFFNVLLLRFIIHFIMQNYSNFNMMGLLSISWGGSSSAMESSMAHDFLLMEMFYLFSEEKRKAFLCMIFCMLSMKRLSFILAPLLLIISNRIPKGVEVNSKLSMAIKVTAIISPFVILGIYSDTFQNWFVSAFNTSLNNIMSGRPAIYETLNSNIPYYNGYGSINSFLGQFVMNQFGTIWNGVLHNDFLRIYLETTIVGVIVLTVNLVNLAKKEYWYFLMIVYLIFVAITSHILNYFSVWVTFYMIVMCSNRKNYH